MDLVEGKRLFEGRTEYPLPKISRTRDYIFYFVSSVDGYGKGARYFFNRFYKNHQSNRVSSLEALINHLASEITNRGVRHIREVVIVSHGNAQGLILPLINGVSASDNQKYKYVTAGSLASLQQDFNAGQLVDFFNKRKTVIEKLEENSWVTVRACNFGQSKLGMYALYAFFGGRANVYCPKVFQFFGTHSIMEGMRLESKIEVHKHLVKQRFLPKDTLTRDRKDAIARFLSDPERFSESTDLITANLEDQASTETQEYEGIIDDLNRRRLNASLVSRLNANGISLTSQRRVIRVVRDSVWIIRDRLVHEGERHIVEYHLSEAISLPDATLQVEATIADIVSARAFFPLQLFFDNDDNKEWRGELFVLASYTEAADADPDLKTRFEAALELLEGLAFGDTIAGAFNIVQEFAEEEHNLTAAKSLTLLSSEGSGSNERKTWRLNDATNYLIKLQHPATSGGIPAHALVVYEDLSGKDALLREYELMSRIGTDPDLPGTELLSYLDNRSFDELTNLIDYLRSPYEARNVVYISHAIQAIRRKHDYNTWFFDLPEFKAQATNPDPLFPIDFKWTSLDYSEREDLRTAVYTFETDIFWAEVKVSDPPEQPFGSDLFTEQLFTFTASPLTTDDHLEPDSPSADIEKLRSIQRQGLEAFFPHEKFTIDEAVADPNEMSCEKFRQFIVLIQELAGKSESEIEAALNDFELNGEPSLTNFYKLPKPIIWAKDFWDATAPKAEVALLEKGVDALITRYPSLATGTAGRIATLGRFYARNSAAIGLYLLVFEMFSNFLKAQSDTLNIWEQTGKLTAFRQFARRLKTMTFTREEDFPTTISIDLGDNVVESYFQEQRDEHGVFFPFIFGPDRMKKGFDEGKILIAKEANEMLSRSDRTLNDAMRAKGLDNCKIHVLRDAGLIDPSRSRAMIMRSYADSILRGLPNV